MADNSSFEILFENACLNALKSFSLDGFRQIQQKALKEIVLGIDVLVILPTGSGKSLIFQTAPLVFDEMSSSSGSIVLVISPLVSLMKDQVNFLVSKGIKAAFLGQEQEDESIKVGIERGEYQIVYGSPETFLTNNRWRSMLTSSAYRKNLRLLCIDEAHCISQWGFSSKKGEKAFRIWFSRINEIRSLVSSIPVLALTATATKKTRQRICRTLEMEDAVTFTVSPNRVNVGYSVQLVSCDILKTFSALIEELKVQKASCQRVIIYCPRISVVSNLYGIFKSELGDLMFANGDTSNLKQRTVEMYHARIDEENKTEILNNFSEENGVIRVLLATIAYGMGIDCKGVKTVIHYGLPTNLESYMQESGRAGRSGESGCKSVILYSNIMLRHCDDDVINYVRNDSQCRRELLLGYFGSDSNEHVYNHPHECCDVCQKQCKCEGESCSFQFFSSVITSIQQDHTYQREVTSNDISVLKSKLEYLQRSLNNSYATRSASTAYPLFTPVSLISGFGECQIIQVIENAAKLLSLEDVYRFVDIWYNDVAIEILYVINTVFGDIHFNFDTESEDEDEALEMCFWDNNEDDGALLEALAGFTIAEDVIGGFDIDDDELSL